jgi:hypothetical protein
MGSIHEKNQGPKISCYCTFKLFCPPPRSLITPLLSLYYISPKPLTPPPFFFFLPPLSTPHKKFLRAVQHVGWRVRGGGKGGGGGGYQPALVNKEEPSIHSGVVHQSSHPLQFIGKNRSCAMIINRGGVGGGEGQEEGRRGIKEGRGQ